MENQNGIFSLIRKFFLKPILSVLMIFFSILLCLVVGEGVLWVFFPISEEQPYQKIMLQDIPGLKPNILYERNAQGLRSLSMVTRKNPPKTFRILCLRASTTDQTNQGTPDT